MDSTAYRGIGLMCGTSHDALDMADVSFWKLADKWQAEIHACESVSLPVAMRKRLAVATELSGFELTKLDRDFARFCGTEVNRWRSTTASKAEYIASHGVTVFHQPDSAITLQLGNGGTLSTISGLKVISDFRIQDVAAGGNGAPLVPFADQALFSEYDFTLNLGGFANVSILNEASTVGYDICACNLMLNALAKRVHLEYDSNGDLASKGSLIPELLNEWEQLPHFDLPAPKSLGYEWVKEQVWPILMRFDEHKTENLLFTACQHISEMVGKALNTKGKVLVTGGGTHNGFLMDLIRSKTKAEIVVPDRQMIDFREAIAFAFLGLQRLIELPNIYPSVTGARQQSVAGAVYLPP